MHDQPEHDPLVSRFQRSYQAATLPRPEPPRRRIDRGAGLLVIAAASLMVVLGVRGVRHTGVSSGADSLVTVDFVLVREAATVSVVGDFNGWDPAATPMTRNGSSGLWQASTRLGAGRVEYAFVVDGRTWIPDPNAPMAPAGDFGAANS